MINVGKQRSWKQGEEAKVQQQICLRAFLDIFKDTKLKAKMVKVTTLMHQLSRGRAMLQGDHLDACIRVHGQTRSDLKTFPYEKALESWLARIARRSVTTIVK
jgi:hypothetical protein